MLRRLCVLALSGLPFLMFAAVGASESLAQPTFGRPKQDRPRPADPADPNEVKPDESAAPVMEDWREGDPERAEPSDDAKPGVWYAGKTTEGFRYAWSLPVKFEPGKGYNLVVILHPDNHDFRWGVANHQRVGEGVRPENVFRPNDLLVSVDGVTANNRRGRGTLRTWEINPQSAVKFRDVLLELSRDLPVQRIYLYGYGAGGRFAAYMAGVFPAVTDGVLAHGSRIDGVEPVKSTVPLVFIHGAKDSQTTLEKSFAATDEYRSLGHDFVRLRVLRGYNDFLNPVRASECIDFIDGLRTEKPADALAAAERMLTPKFADEYEYRCPVWYAGANEILKRVIGECEPKFEKTADETTASRARALIKRIDDEGAAHVAKLRELLGENTVDARTLVLDGGAWLGYSVALRDDFRGVESVETFYADFAWELLRSAHETEAKALLEVWNSETATDADKFVKLADTLPNGFLYEAFPVDISARSRVCMRKADELEIPEDARGKYEYITLWDDGWRNGLNAYQRRWSQWTFEPGK